MPTILFVEDEELLRSGVQELLEMHDFTVIGAADGLEALHWIYETNVDLVITDLVMPVMNGVDFIARLTKTHPDLPVIVVSGSGTALKTCLGVDSIDVPGARASFLKPFKSEALVAKIRDLLAPQA